MNRAAPDWPAQKTREFIAVKHERLFSQVRGIFGETRAYGVIVRAFLRKAEETDADAFEEPRRG